MSPGAKAGAAPWPRQPSPGLQLGSRLQAQVSLFRRVLYPERASQVSHAHSSANKPCQPWKGPTGEVGGKALLCPCGRGSCGPSWGEPRARLGLSGVLLSRMPTSGRAAARGGPGGLPEVCGRPRWAALPWGWAGGRSAPPHLVPGGGLAPLSPTRRRGLSRLSVAPGGCLAAPGSEPAPGVLSAALPALGPGARAKSRWSRTLGRGEGPGPEVPCFLHKQPGAGAILFLFPIFTSLLALFSSWGR